MSQKPTKNRELSNEDKVLLRFLADDLEDFFFPICEEIRGEFGRGHKYAVDSVLQQIRRIVHEYGFVSKSEERYEKELADYYAQDERRNKIEEALDIAGRNPRLYNDDEPTRVGDELGKVPSVDRNFR